jgi:hypothetical protein
MKKGDENDAAGCSAMRRCVKVVVLGAEASVLYACRSLGVGRLARSTRKHLRACDRDMSVEEYGDPKKQTIEIAYSHES